MHTHDHDNDKGAAPALAETDAGSLLELEDALLHEVTGGQADVDSEPDGNGVEQGGFGTA